MKVNEVTLTGARSAPAAATDKREQTFLKKIDPPKFGGNPVEFGETEHVL